MDISDGWNFRATVIEGEPVEIAGRNVWAAEWVPVAVGSVIVPHPSYSHQRHHMSVYRLGGVEPAKFFAAGEFSNAVWGLYEPTASMRRFLTTRT